MLDLLDEQSLEKDAEILEKFYQSVKTRAAGIDNAEGKQRIIIELYDKFFKTAFPKLVEKLGIVYSPVEVVDFIIYSVNDILIKEFGRSISDENVHLLDPFTGTGTFITRLLQSGLISKEDLLRKYTSEIHCNEIVLLAYYIAAVNIENTFHDLLGKDATYQAFEGICLTDTFQLGESHDGEKLFSEMFPQNSKRVQRQQNAPLRIIFGNPPYSMGQKYANDNAQNQSYPKLDSRIAETYAKLTDAISKKSLYDSYFKAFRWSADRLDKTGGIIAFVSNGGWLDGNSTDGFRKSIEKEFTSIYVFNLRGNARTSGELRQQEGGGVFGLGSRTPIAITLMVRNPDVKTEKATIHYHEIGEYLTREEKLKIISGFKSFANENIPLKILQPNEEGDWISLRNNLFSTFIQLGDKENKQNNCFFKPFYSRGVNTARDSYCYNSNKANLTSKIKEFISYYESVREQFQLLNKTSRTSADNYIDFSTNKVTWNRGLKNDLNRNKQIEFNDNKLYISSYRPFFKQHVYFAQELNDMIYQMPKIFPTNQTENLAICVSSNYKDGSVLISNLLPDSHFNGDTQAFPLYYYEANISKQKGLFDEESKNDYIRRDAISDFIFKRAEKIYGKNVTKEDIFYYVYGFLHSKEYRETFANDLKKMLPRLPLVEEVKVFWAFSKAGRKLAELHLNYETVAPYADAKVMGDDGKFYIVEKLRFPKKEQKDTIIYNSKITISNIPAKAYEYVVNGKSAIEWIMERYQVTTHKESGIKNDPNDWAEEVGNPRYILDLLLSVINVSVQTVEIVEGLPKVKFE